MSTVVEAPNQMRWRYQRGHYEVWYATLSHLPTRTGFWIRYTLESPLVGHGAPYAQLWFARFDPADPARTFGFNRKLGIDQLKHEEAPFRLRLGDATLEDGRLAGALAGEDDRGQAHQVSWSVEFAPADRPLLMLPTLSYRGSVPETVALSPHQDVRARGLITVDGERYELDATPLGQTHLWGRKHSYSHAWAHCNAFDHPRASFEALTARLRRGSVVLPRLTMFTLVLDEERISFREPWEMPLVHAEYGTGRYLISATSPKIKIEAELTCRPDDLVMAEYVDPDGDPLYCHNTECGDASIRVSRRSPFFGRLRDAGHLKAAGTAHFEWTARAGDPTVRRRHATVRPAILRP
jgi:hypothetical protein